MLDANFKIERVLNFRHAGEVRQGKATIGGIRLAPDRKQWLCDVSIDYLGEETVTVQGDDPLDAFNHCLFFLSEVILGGTEHGWSVWWQIEGDHGGFVVYQ